MFAPAEVNDSVSPRTSLLVLQALTSFSGQRLTRQSTYCPLPTRRSKRGVVTAHSHGPPPRTPLPGTGGEAENILDDISRYIYRKVKSVVAPYFPKDFDALAWLPDGIHAKVHNIEVPVSRPYLRRPQHTR